jgi:hypothetical protein
MECGAAGAIVVSMFCGADFIPPSWTNGSGAPARDMGSGDFALRYFTGSARNFSAHLAQQK